MSETVIWQTWEKLLPFIVAAQPFRKQIYRSVNLTEADKRDRLIQQELHLEIVKQERSAYNKMVGSAKDVCRQLGIGELSANTPCSRQIEMHYNFDYAQQVHLPSDPLQSGPIYFLVRLKVGLFGVCCEGVPKQVNFLTDEAHLISQGSNVVIYFLHYVFENSVLGETKVNLYCDNCPGQNTNRFVLWDCAWRVAVGLHKTISLNFLITGHAKFAPDGCLGRLTPRGVITGGTSVCGEWECLQQLCPAGGDRGWHQLRACCGQRMAPALCLLGTEDGTSFVSLGDWQSHLSPFYRPLPGIKGYQHFRFDSAQPGKVFVRETLVPPETTFDMARTDSTVPTIAPAAVPAPGMSAQRQWYLYDSIRQFVSDEQKDVLCPLPSVPRVARAMTSSATQTNSTTVNHYLI